MSILQIVARCCSIPFHFNYVAQCVEIARTCFCCIVVSFGQKASFGFCGHVVVTVVGA